MRELEDKIKQQLTEKSYPRTVIYGTSVQKKISVLIHQRFEESKNEYSHELQKTIFLIVQQMKEMSFNQINKKSFFGKKKNQSIQSLLEKYEETKHEMEQQIKRIEQIHHQLLRSEFINQKNNQNGHHLQTEIELFIAVGEEVMEQWKKEQVDLHIVQALQKRIEQLKMSKHSLLQTIIQINQHNQQIQVLSSSINEIIHNTIPYWKQTIFSIMEQHRRKKNQDSEELKDLYLKVNKETIIQLETRLT